MLKLINDFHHEMPTPIVGIGHSFGANSLAWLGTLHPSLFTAVVLIDPVMSDLVRRGPAFGGVPTIVTAPRRDLWPSREEAAKSLAKNKFYQAWDPRVFELFVKHGLRDTPTKLYPSAPRGSVTLTTTKHQEVFTYGRGHEQNYDPQTGQRIKGDVTTKPVLDLNREQDHRYSPEWPFYRPEIPISAARLPSLRPSAFYLFGETSTVNWPAVREEKRQLTGVGVGGSGGVKAGRVADATLSGLGHLLVFEDPKQCAEHVSKWLGAEMERWRKEDKSRQAWYRSTEVKKDTMDEDWERWIAIAKPQVKPKI
jgi:pimeloyl-ACP methyl ester carboxylesterase